MKCTVLTIGQRLPDWAQTACEDYLKRFPPDWKVEVKAVKAEPREGKPVAAIMQAEAARMLTGADMDLAVARGAAYYGYVRRGQGVRIRGGTARAYYVAIESSMPAIPGMAPPVQALCIAPFGMEEGVEAQVHHRHQRGDDQDEDRDADLVGDEIAQRGHGEVGQRHHQDGGQPEADGIDRAGADGEDRAQAEQLRQAGVLLPQAVPGDLAELLRAHAHSPSTPPAGAVKSASMRSTTKAVLRPAARTTARALMVAPVR